MCLNEGSPFSTVSRKMVVSEALTRDFAALDLQRCSSSSTTTTTRIVPIRVRGELHLPFVNREEVILKVIKTWMSKSNTRKRQWCFVDNDQVQEKHILAHTLEIFHKQHVTYYLHNFHMIMKLFNSEFQSLPSFFLFFWIKFSSTLPIFIFKDLSCTIC